MKVDVNLMRESENISFKPLSQEDFPQLLLWLNKPHVQKYWDRVNWTIEMVEAKYGPRIASEDIECYVIRTRETENRSYMQNLDHVANTSNDYIATYPSSRAAQRRRDLVDKYTQTWIAPLAWLAKTISSFLITSDDGDNWCQIGFIQTYDAYKLPRSKPIEGLPANLGAIDLFIGEEQLLGKGIGAAALDLLIENHVDFEYILVDPQRDNIAAIRTYQKCGFREVARHDDTGEIWMIKKK